MLTQHRTGMLAQHHPNFYLAIQGCWHNTVQGCWHNTIHTSIWPYRDADTTPSTLLSGHTGMLTQHHPHFYLAIQGCWHNTIQGCWHNTIHTSIWPYRDADTTPSTLLSDHTGMLTHHVPAICCHDKKLLNWSACCSGKSSADFVTAHYKFPTDGYIHFMKCFCMCVCLCESIWMFWYIDGLLQERRNSIANALEFVFPALTHWYMLARLGTFPSASLMAKWHPCMKNAIMPGIVILLCCFYVYIDIVRWGHMVWKCPYTRPRHCELNLAVIYLYHVLPMISENSNQTGLCGSAAVVAAHGQKEICIIMTSHQHHGVSNLSTRLFVQQLVPTNMKENIHAMAWICTGKG